MPKNTENSRFFGFQKIIKWPELADKHIKSSGLLQILTRIFWFVQSQKFIELVKKYYPFPSKKGPIRGGGEIIKFRFPQESLTGNIYMKEKKKSK